MVARDGQGQTFQDLCQAALKEGGTLTVHAGGDEFIQGFGIKAGLERSFPGLKVDAAHLQTLHDFDDWARRPASRPCSC